MLSVVILLISLWFFSDQKRIILSSAETKMAFWVFIAKTQALEFFSYVFCVRFIRFFPAGRISLVTIVLSVPQLTT